MKLQIIETEQYILAVSDEEIKDLQPCLNIAHKQIVIPTDLEWANSNRDNLKTIIAYKPKGNAPELDLPLLPEIVVEDDVEKLASFYYGENRSTREFEEGFRKGFKIGYKAATKTFSEEDLRKAFEAGMYFIGEDKGSYEEFIQSLKQSKTPKWFVAEMEEESGFTPNGYYSKIVLKTTTINGKTYLVGHYE